MPIPGIYALEARAVCHPGADRRTHAPAISLEAWVCAGRPEDQESSPPQVTLSKVDNLTKPLVADVTNSGKKIAKDR